MAAATSRSMLKSSFVALDLFNKSKPIVNRMLTLRALPSIESSASQLINQMEGFDEKMLTQQLPARIVRSQSVSEVMLMARYYRKVPVIEEDEDDDVEEFGDESDIDMIDEEDDEDEDDDEFDDEDEEFVKTKVRTRSHRDL